MRSPKSLIGTMVVLASLSFTTTSAQLLQAVNTTAHMPYPNFWFPHTYDGNDTIYIGPGFEVPFNMSKSMMKYSISTDTLTVLDVVPWQSGGFSYYDKADGEVYTAGGSGQGLPPPIYVWAPDSLTSARVANLSASSSMTHFAGIYDNNRTIYTFGGTFQSYKVFTMDTVTHEVNMLGDLPKWLSWNEGFFDGNETAYIFCNDEYDNPNPGVLAYNIRTNVGTVLPGDIPPMNTQPSVAYDGRYAYLFGAGLYGTEEPADGIYQYDPIAQTSTFIQVANYPASVGRWFSGMGVVYIERLNRIYYIGGGTGIVNPVFWSNIGYIDLSPINGKKPLVDL